MDQSIPGLFSILNSSQERAATQLVQGPNDVWRIRIQTWSEEAACSSFLPQITGKPINPTHTSRRTAHTDL
jgi:hypothetical protein